MGRKFRDAVFDLCKRLSTHPESERIRKTIHDMMVFSEFDGNDSKSIKRPSHGDLAHIGLDQRVQFLGYLLADESVEDINANSPFHVTHLATEERLIIEEAYKTIRLFIDLCIDEIKGKYPKASMLLDPYCQYNQPKVADGVISFLNEDDFQGCIETFKNGKIYKQIINNSTLQIIEGFDKNTIKQIEYLQNKQFSDDLKSASKETIDFFRKIDTVSKIDTADILMAYTIYCRALRRSLEIAAQMIFEAIMGEKMTIMNVDNIIDLTDHHSDIVYEKYVVLIQDVLFRSIGKRTGSLALLVCDPTDEYHIKEFGVIVALTVSFQNEYGSTSKVTIVTVDDELNEIHTLTDAIMKTDLRKSLVY